MKRYSVQKEKALNSAIFNKMDCFKNKKLRSFVQLYPERI